MSQTETALSLGDSAVSTPRRASGWEWSLCWLMFASTVLCYMDRQAIALVKPKVVAEFQTSNEGFGWVLATFALSYALFQVPAGYLADRWNVSWTYAGAVAWWSLAGILSAFSPTLGVLLACRALLGVGESFNWPCALRVTAMVLPPADRSLGNGIFNSGAAVGAVLTPLTVPLLTERFGWRAAFIAVGALGFAWVVGWFTLLRGGRAALFSGRSKPDDAAAGPDELPLPLSPVNAGGLAPPALGVFAALVVSALLVAGSAARYGPAAIWWAIAILMIGALVVTLVFPEAWFERSSWAGSLSEVVRLRRFWVLAVVSISVNVCWHFLVNWMAPYLQEDRKLGYLIGGMVVALPFLAADAGNLGGGYLSRLLARRGMPLLRARMGVIAASALLISSGAGIGWLRSDALIITLLAIMALGTAAYMANYFAFCQEVSARHTGLVVGILGGLGNLFAGGFLPIAGRIKDTTGSFGPSFVLVGLLPLLGVAALVLAWGHSGAEAGPAGPKPS